MNQEPKDKKPLTDEELEQAAGGIVHMSADASVGVEVGGGGTPTTGGTPSTGDTDPGLAASGMDPDTYYAIFPAARPLPTQGPQ